MEESKKRVSFDPNVQSQSIETKRYHDEPEESNLPFAKKFKHTLDSDEEDDEEKSEKYNILADNEFDGEEEGLLRREEDITITPFNMKEELEEGKFDDQGMYIFKKETEEIKDHWLDNIDWVQVKEPTDTNLTAQSETNQEKEEEKISFNDYRKLVSLMKPDETVQKTIRRLGGGKRVLQKKKATKTQTLDPEAEKRELEKKQMMDVISLADRILCSGDMDIYERTYEQLTFRLSEIEKEEKEANEDIFAS